MTRVDVAIPCYQFGRFLRDCVTSVLTQEIKDVRVLIIDNASTDNSLEVARQLALEDSRVEIVAHRTNLGHTASFNEAIEWASSEYFLLLFADDLLAPGCLARALSVMTRHPDVSFACGRVVPLYGAGPIPTIDADGQSREWRLLTGREFIERFCRAAVFHVCGPTLVVRTSAQKQAGYYRAELPHSDDYDMWLRLACLGNVAETDAIQAILRTHDSQRSFLIRESHSRHVVNTGAAIASFFANEGRLLPEAARLQRMARRSLAERAYWSAVSNVYRGNASDGLKLFRIAFGLRPTTAIIPPVDYLFRRDDALRRIAEVLSGATSATANGGSAG